MAMFVWIVVIAIIALLLFLWIKLEHQARLIKFVIVTLIVVMLVGSLFLTLSSGETDLSSPKGIVNAVYLYIGWLGGFTVDMWDLGVETTGKVINAMNVSESASN